MVDWKKDQLLFIAPNVFVDMSLKYILTVLVLRRGLRRLSNSTHWQEKFPRIDGLEMGNYVELVLVLVDSI